MLGDVTLVHHSLRVKLRDVLLAVRDSGVQLLAEHRFAAILARSGCARLGRAHRLERLCCFLLQRRCTRRGFRGGFRGGGRCRSELRLKLLHLRGCRLQRRCARARARCGFHGSFRGSGRCRRELRLKLLHLRGHRLPLRREKRSRRCCRRCRVRRFRGGLGRSRLGGGDRFGCRRRRSHRLRLRRGELRAHGGHLRAVRVDGHACRLDLAGLRSALCLQRGEVRCNGLRRRGRRSELLRELVALRGDVRRRLLRGEAARLRRSELEAQVLRLCGCARNRFGALTLHSRERSGHCRGRSGSESGGGLGHGHGRGDGGLVHLTKTRRGERARLSGGRDRGNVARRRNGRRNLARRGRDGRRGGGELQRKAAAGGAGRVLALRLGLAHRLGSANVASEDLALELRFARSVKPLRFEGLVLQPIFLGRLARSDLRFDVLRDWREIRGVGVEHPERRARAAHRAHRSRRHHL